MPASTLTRNSTNVRNAVNLAWHRLSLAVTSALAKARAVETAARLFSTLWASRSAHRAAGARLGRPRRTATRLRAGAARRGRRELRAVLIAPPTSVERYSGFFARKLGIPEPVRRAMQERFERSLGQRWSQFELPQAVADVRAKALVIHDAGDREVAQAGGIALARAWPGARFSGTRGLGHRLILRDATVVRDAVDFLAGEVEFAPPPPRGAAAFGAPAPIL